MGPARAAVARLVARLQRTARVRLHGRVGAAALADGLAGALLVNPTVLAEGFQTSLLEVLAAGGAVVTSDVAGARELARDGAPVTLAEADVRAVAAAIEARLQDAAAFPPESVRRWGWDSRVGDLAVLLGEVVPPGRPRLNI